MGGLSGEQLIAVISLTLNTVQVLFLAVLKHQEYQLRAHLDDLHQENQQLMAPAPPGPTQGP